MNTHTPTDAWIHRLIIVLASTVTVSLVGAFTMVVFLNQPVPQILIALGIIATVCLVRLLVPILLIR